MPDLEQAATGGNGSATGSGRFITRFTAAQRYMHGVLFSSFLGLAATGLPRAWAGSARSSSSTSCARWC